MNLTQNRVANDTRFEAPSDSQSLPNVPSKNTVFIGTTETCADLLRFGKEMVRSSGFEPPRYCYRQPLKLVRLPVPPRPHRGRDFIVAVLGKSGKRATGVKQPELVIECGGLTSVLRSKVPARRNSSLGI